MDFRFIDDLTMTLHDWLAENGFDAGVRGMESDFMYYIGDDTIAYSLLMEEESVRSWQKLLDELKCPFVVDPFISAFGHELGHSETYHILTEEEIEYSDKMKEEISDNYTYYHLPVEIEATKWFINWGTAHLDALKDLSNRVARILAPVRELMKG